MQYIDAHGAMITRLPPFEPMILHEFSYSGTSHNIPGGINAELALEDESARYAGRIVLYIDAAHKFWIRPEFEFCDGRYTEMVA